MKNCFYVAAVLLLVFWMACKKQSCDDVTCPADYLCVDGVCRLACDGNPYLVRDSCGGVVCGPHQILVRDTCWCDTNWVGGKCDIPIGLLVGRYHVKGSSYSFSGSNSTSMDFETDVTIERNGDTLFYGGYAHTYAAYMDTTVYFPFAYPISPGKYSTLRFKRTLDDSVFYDMQSGGMGGGTETSFKGVRIQ